MAFAALLFSLVSGAWAMTALPKNSVGSQQIAKNAVGSSELSADAVSSRDLSANAVLSRNISDGAVGEAQIANQAVGAAALQQAAVTQAAMGADSVGAAQLRAQAVNQEAMANDSVGAAQLEAAAVAQQNMQANSIGAAQLQAAVISQAKMQAGAIGAPQLQNDAVTKSKLAPDATSSLYVHTEPNRAITGDTLLGTLTLPAGNYLLTASAGGVNTSTTLVTRFECWLANGATLIDYAKVRLQENSSSNALIFAKLPLDAGLSLASAGTVTMNCTSVDGTSIDLSDIHLMALRVAEIIPQ